MLTRSYLLKLPMTFRGAQVYGSWFMPYWLGHLTILGITIVGYWRMRRWSLYLYVINVLFALLFGAVMGLPFTTFDLVGAILFIAPGFIYFRRFN